MRSDKTVPLAIFAAVIAAAAVVLHLVRHGFDDLFGVIGPVIIISLMFVILSKNKARPNG